ncbi:hypothetical protein [Streptomyces sp. enrichment culture]|uniref:hypothetical protein n=1 Tax=Streptomyces sp. enrichment culture TaxID=1795815 RepID=UPI003F5457CF
MVTLRHTVLLTPVPRAWSADALATALDVVESTRAEADGRLVLPDGRPVPDVRLTGGRHLRRGAVHEGEPGSGAAGSGGAAAGRNTAPAAHGTAAPPTGDPVTAVPAARHAPAPRPRVTPPSSASPAAGRR